MFRIDQSHLSIKTHSNSIYPCQFKQVVDNVPSGYRLYENSLEHPIYLLQAEEKGMPTQQHDLSGLKLKPRCKLIIDMKVDRQEQMVLPNSGLAIYFVGDKANINSCKLRVKGRDPLAKVEWSGVYSPDALTETAQKKRKLESGAIKDSLPPADTQDNAELKRKDVTKKPVESAPPKAIANASLPAAAPRNAFRRLPAVNKPAVAPQSAQPAKEIKAEVKRAEAKREIPKTPNAEIKNAAPNIRKLKNTEQHKLGNAALKKYLDLASDEKAMEAEDKKRFGKKLKAHQNQSLVEILQARQKQEVVKGAFIKPTGSGKTIIMVSLAQITKEKTAIIVPSNEIGEQTTDEVMAINERLPPEERLIIVNVLKEINKLKINGKTKTEDEKRKLLSEIFLKADILIFSYQYLRSKGSLFKLMPWDCISVVNLDEAHESCSSKSKEIIQHVAKQGCHIHAYTASPILFKSSARIQKGGANDVYQLLDLTPETNPFSELDIRDTIDQGINCPIKIFHLTIQEEKGEDLTIGGAKGNDFKEEVISNVINQEKFNLIVAHQYANGVDPVSQFPFRGQYGVVFCGDVEHCIKAAAQINAVLSIDEMDPDGRLRAEYAKRRLEHDKKTFSKHYYKTLAKKHHITFEQAKQRFSIPDQMINEKEIEEKAKKEFMVAGACHSGMKRKERDEMFLKIKLGGVLLATNVDMLVRGLDNHRFVLIFALRPTRAETVKKQGPGRGLRVNPDDPNKICYLFEFIWGETECVYYFQFLTRNGIPQAQWGDRIEEFRKQQPRSQFKPIDIPGVAKYQRHDDLKQENKKVIIGGKPIRYKTLQAVKAKKEKKNVPTKAQIELPVDIKDALKQLIEGVDLLDLQFIKFKKEVTVEFEADEKEEKPFSIKKLKPTSSGKSKEEIKSPPLDIATKHINTILNKAESKLSQIANYIAPPARKDFNPAPNKAGEKCHGKDEKVETLSERLKRLRKESLNLKEKINKLYFKAHLPQFESMDSREDEDQAEEEKTLQSEIQRVAQEFQQILQEVEVNSVAIKQSIKLAHEEAQKKLIAKKIKEDKPKKLEKKKAEKMASSLEIAQQIIDLLTTRIKNFNVYHFGEISETKELKKIAATWTDYFGEMTKILLQQKDKRDALAQWRYASNGDAETSDQVKGGSVLHYLANFSCPTVAYHSMIDAILDNEELKLNVNLQDEKGNTPLHLLAKPFKYRYHREQILHYVFKLVAKGANLNITNVSGYTPIHIPTGYSPVHLAILSGNFTLASLFIGFGARLDDEAALIKLQMELECAPVRKTIINQQSLTFMQQNNLFSAKTPPVHEIKGERGRTLLHDLVVVARLDMITAILPWFKDRVNVRDSNQCTPLHYVFNESISKTRLSSVFRLSLREKDIPKIATVLMDHGADVNVVDESKNTPLHYAFKNLKLYQDAISPLLALLRDEFINFSNEEGQTLSHVFFNNYFSRSSHEIKTIFNSLMERKADPTLVDKNGCTAMHYALRHLDEASFDIVLNMARAIDFRKGKLFNNNGDTYLHLLCHARARVDPKKLIELASLLVTEQQAISSNADKMMPLHILMHSYKASLFPLVEYLVSFNIGYNSLYPHIYTSLHEFCNRRYFVSDTLEEVCVLFASRGFLFLHRDQYDRIALEYALANLTQASFRMVEKLLHFSLKEAVHVGRFNLKGQNALHLLASSNQFIDSQLLVQMAEVIKEYYISQYQINPLNEMDREYNTPLFVLFKNLNANKIALAIKMLNDADPAIYSRKAFYFMTLFHLLFKVHGDYLAIDSRFQLFKILMSKIPSDLLIPVTLGGGTGLQWVIHFLKTEIKNCLHFKGKQDYSASESLLKSVELFKQELVSFVKIEPALFAQLNHAIFELARTLPSQVMMQPLPLQALQLPQAPSVPKPLERRSASISPLASLMEHSLSQLALQASHAPSAAGSLEKQATSDSPSALQALPLSQVPSAPKLSERVAAWHASSLSILGSSARDQRMIPPVAGQSFFSRSAPKQPPDFSPISATHTFFSSRAAANPQHSHFSRNVLMEAPKESHSESAQMSDLGYPFAAPNQGDSLPTFFSSHSLPDSLNAAFGSGSGASYFDPAIIDDNADDEMTHRP